MINYSKEFTNKVVIITGAGSGIGKETAKRMIDNGAKVALWDYNKDALNNIQKSLGDNSIAINVDISDEFSVKEAADRVRNEIGSPEILINCAGVAGDNATVENTEVDEWRRVININLTGTFICCREIVSDMIKNNYGRIVNIASVAGKDGNANASAYSAAKAGVLGLTKSLGKELAQYNIAVNAVTPAGAKTRILNQMTKEHVQRMLSKVPRGRFLELDELSSLVCWLSSEENSFSTAAIFDISGGRSTY